MKPNISEFSYGYALTDELVHASGITITGAPVFPSLYSEGQAGGGWDVRIDRPGVPLFLQFKLSDKMKRGNCRERANTGLAFHAIECIFARRGFHDSMSCFWTSRRKGKRSTILRPHFTILTS